MADSAPESQYAKKPAYPETMKPKARPARPHTAPAAMFGAKPKSKASKAEAPQGIARIMRLLANARSGR